jgi:hypothetical protein
VTPVVGCMGCVVRVMLGDGPHWATAFGSCRAIPGPAGLGRSPSTAQSRLHAGPTHKVSCQVVLVPSQKYHASGL